MKLRGGRGARSKKPAPTRKKVGRPKKNYRRTCPQCRRKLKTPQGLKKHLAKELKCDPASVAARTTARKELNRRAAKRAHKKKGTPPEA
ncbi:hypothetical protein PR002_g2188 [Phytophthora rubi]|uniref:Uncharacterized protein n=1 Tax=Phytophthora rubi TaxID=129364 RepID=A0A6A3NQN1_9STRA|nr:hypothetical protein PR002_g2188 [Phytophthora rubi]